VAVSFLEPPDWDVGDDWSEEEMLRLNFRNDQYLCPDRFPDDTDFSEIRGGRTGGDWRDGGVGGGGLGEVGNGGQAVKKMYTGQKLILSWYCVTQDLKFN